MLAICASLKMIDSKPLGEAASDQRSLKTALSIVRTRSMTYKTEGRLRARLNEYIRTLSKAGVSDDFLVECAAEFIKEQTNPDRRYSGC
jgi:hypothetical protein